MRRPESRMQSEDRGRRGVEGKYVMSVAVGMTGVEAYRIRRYEVGGLLRPVRSVGGRRLLSDEEICLIREVARLEGEGVNVKGIRLILKLKQAQGSVPDGCGGVQEG